MLSMYDSIDPADLPPGGDAYLGYTDGRWPDYQAIAAREHVPVIGLAVTAADDAEGLDVEAGDAAPGQAAAWTARQHARGVTRPVLYASASVIGGVLAACAAASIGRGQVRLLSAHYGAGRHVCGPATCAYPGVPACDGTQWTDGAPGAAGTLVDESALLDDFFPGGGTMALSADDLTAIARVVWQTDGLIASPVATPANPDWWPSRTLADIAVRVRATQAAVTGLASLTGLAAGAADPGRLAAAIAAALGPDLAADVAAELSRRLAS